MKTTLYTLLFLIATSFSCQAQNLIPSCWVFKTSNGDTQYEFTVEFKDKGLCNFMLESKTLMQQDSNNKLLEHELHILLIAEGSFKLTNKDLISYTFNKDEVYMDFDVYMPNVPLEKRIDSESAMKDYVRRNMTKADFINMLDDFLPSTGTFKINRLTRDELQLENEIDVYDFEPIK